MVPFPSYVDVDESRRLGARLCCGVSTVGVESVRDQYELHADWRYALGDQFPVQTIQITFVVAKDIRFGVDSGMNLCPAMTTVVAARTHPSSSACVKQL